ncbi:MAG: hypothetical protein H6822_11590 [Planctomycetaceae bacterium]|nr:hypothetical protein [Planctomycetales bacterium]MCB9922818.1 hypothetical protein [Planctomycetaceae bacterium]
MLKKFVIVFSIVALAGQATTANGQVPNESDAVVTNALTRRVEQFFGHLKTPSVSAEDAFSELLSGGPLDGRTEQLRAFVENYKKLEASYGRFLIAKPIRAERVGDDLTFLTFLYESEQFPIVWRFAFYRPPLETLERPDWFVVRLSFDTKLESLTSSP